MTTDPTRICPLCLKAKNRIAFRRKLWGDELARRLNQDTLDQLRAAGRQAVYIYEEICRACHPRGSYRPTQQPRPLIESAHRTGIRRAHLIEHDLTRKHNLTRALLSQARVQQRIDTWKDELAILRAEDRIMSSRRSKFRHDAARGRPGVPPALIDWLDAYLVLLRRIRDAALLRARLTPGLPAKVGGWRATLTDALERDLASLRGIYTAHSLYAFFPRRPPLLLDRAKEPPRQPTRR